MQLLGSCLYKMMRSAVQQPFDLDPTTGEWVLKAPTLVLVTKDRFAKSEVKFQCLEFSGSLPRGSTNPNFFLLRALPSGRDGRVWLGCSSSGTVVVIKFLFSDEPSDTAADREVQAWRRMYGSSSGAQSKISQPAWKVTLNGKPAVVMPYYQPACAYSENKQVQKAVRDEINRWVDECEHMHGDLEWRHVGLVWSKQEADASGGGVGSPEKKMKKGKGRSKRGGRGGGRGAEKKESNTRGVKVVFFDLSDVVQLRTQEEKNKARNIMMTRLGLGTAAARRTISS